MNSRRRSRRRAMPARPVPTGKGKWITKKIKCDECHRSLLLSDYQEGPVKHLCPKCVRRLHKKRSEAYRRSPGYRRHLKGLKRRGEALLRSAERAFKLTGPCDSAVRDTASTGLAYILHAAYDCLGCARQLVGDKFRRFVASNIVRWFRDKGFAEWFAQGCADLFTSTRHLYQRLERGRRRARRAFVPKNKGRSA